jgi:hypothetical protein
MLKFMADAGEIAENISVLHHVLDCPAPRSAEHLDIKIRNSTTPRTYFFDHGSDMLVTRHKKTDNRTSSTPFIPYYPCPELQAMTRFYLIVVRPVEVKFAEQLWGPGKAQLYSEYLCVAMGSAVEDAFSEILQRKLYIYADCDGLRSRSWRSLSCAIKREFIPPEYDVEGDFDDISDEVQGHHTSTAVAFYAGEHGCLPGLTADIRMRCRARPTYTSRKRRNLVFHYHHPPSRHHQQNHVIRATNRMGTVIPDQRFNQNRELD